MRGMLDLLQGWDLLQSREWVKQSLEGHCACIWCQAWGQRRQQVGRKVVCKVGQRDGQQDALVPTWGSHCRQAPNIQIWRGAVAFLPPPNPRNCPLAQPMLQSSQRKKSGGTTGTVGWLLPAPTRQASGLPVRATARDMNMASSPPSRECAHLLSPYWSPLIAESCKKGHSEKHNSRLAKPPHCP